MMITRIVTCPHSPAMGRRFFARRSERNVIIMTIARARERERKSVLGADTWVPGTCIIASISRNE